MVLDDLLDDGEAEARALGPSRHIGLGQSPALGRQADAAVGYLDPEAALLLDDADGDAVALTSAPFIALLLNSLDAVLDNVGHRLPEQPPVADQVRTRIGRLEAERDVRMRDLVEEDRLANDV